MHATQKEYKEFTTVYVLSAKKHTINYDSYYRSNRKPEAELPNANIIELQKPGLRVWFSLENSLAPLYFKNKILSLELFMLHNHGLHQ